MNGDLCDVELRSCINGELTGSYGYESCDIAKIACAAGVEEEHITYRKHILNNVSMIDPFVQPDAYDNGLDVDTMIFDEYGQIIDPYDVFVPQGVSHEEAFAYPVWEPDTTPAGDCIAPWNERVQDGQFVKAYKYPEGHGEFACEVELRQCANGYLQGTFLYESCSYN